MVGSTRNCIQCFKIWAGAQLEPVFGGSATRFKFFKLGLRIFRINDFFVKIYSGKNAERERYDQDHSRISWTEIFKMQEMCPSNFRFTRGIHWFNQPRSKTVFSWECQGYQSLVINLSPGRSWVAPFWKRRHFEFWTIKWIPSLTIQNKKLL